MYHLYELLLNYMAALGTFNFHDLLLVLQGYQLIENWSLELKRAYICRDYMAQPAHNFKF